MTEVTFDGKKQELTAEIARQAANSLDKDSHAPLEFDGVTTADIDPNKVLKEAMHKLDRVLIIGIDEEGDIYCASSISDIGTLFVDIHLAKEELISSIRGKK